MQGRSGLPADASLRNAVLDFGTDLQHKKSADAKTEGRRIG